MICVAAPPGFRLLDCITNFVFMFSKRVKSCNGSRTVARTVRDTLTGVPQTYLVRSRTDSSVFGTQSFTVRKKSVQRRAALAPTHPASSASYRNCSQEGLFKKFPRPCCVQAGATFVSSLSRHCSEGPLVAQEAGACPTSHVHN